MSQKKAQPSFTLSKNESSPTLVAAQAQKTVIESWHGSGYNKRGLLHSTAHDAIVKLQVFLQTNPSESKKKQVLEIKQFFKHL
jgi:hypothetical protein